MPPSLKRRNSASRKRDHDTSSTSAAATTRTTTTTTTTTTTPTMLDPVARRSHVACLATGVNNHRKLSSSLLEEEEEEEHSSKRFQLQHYHHQCHPASHTPVVTDMNDGDLDSSSLSCLHCHRPSAEVQVRCDECQAYICPSCHWCHEYQANHEIRVCDRCDAFYCRHCDEMDQCDDCGEVVCASCSTLLSCKFCGGGLCEECATACGRCGIVLCSRDAKFAVDCDTCRLSYCLVCLASGSKDPCVRCGHRPSKRMEQLVHLRLKSIYKAFKQSNKAPRNINGSNSSNNFSDMPPMHPDMMAENGPTIEELEEGMEDFAHTTNINDNYSKNISFPGRRPFSRMGGQSHQKEDFAAGGIEPEKVLEEKQKEADAAAEALLAELEEEEEAVKTKKSKKKKKKARQQAKKKEDEPTPTKDAQPVSDPPPTTTAPQPSHAEPNEKLPAAVTQSHAPSESLSIPNVTQSPARSSPKQGEKKDLSQPEPEMDPYEKRLYDCVEENDVDGIEGILFELKGVPGRAVLRKNAKKALKRLRAPTSANASVDGKETRVEKEEEAPMTSSPPENTAAVLGPMELLRIVSDKNVPGKQANRAECVMQIAPNIVGWVIGKGGQRIRDLMEESGAKVWIDQEKAKPEEARNVYIGGDRRSVDQAVYMVQDLISKAPIEGAEKYAPKVSRTSGQDVKTAAVDTLQPMPIAAEAVAVPQNKLPRHAKDPPPVAGGLETQKDPLPNRAGIQPLAFLESTGNDEKYEHVMTCEARFVPLLIGKRGWAIKDIQDKSGARVDIDQTVTPRQIRISGSRANVDKAIPMVRDVLSYPHAQPQHGGLDLVADAERLLSVEAVLQSQDAPSPVAIDADSCPHTPPPYSFITTGDAKSAISASSSLSSTPEPSTSSSAAKTLQPPPTFGPLIPAQDYDLPNGPSQMLSQLPSGGHFLHHDGPQGFNHHRGGGPGIFGDGGLMGMHPHSNMPGMETMLPGHANQEQIYGHGVKPAPHDLGRSMMQGPSPPSAMHRTQHGPGYSMVPPLGHSGNAGHRMVMHHQQPSRIDQYDDLGNHLLGGPMLPGQGASNPFRAWNQHRLTSEPPPGIAPTSRMHPVGMGPSPGPASRFGSSFPPPPGSGPAPSSMSLGGGFNGMGQPLSSNGGMQGIPLGNPGVEAAAVAASAPLNSLRDDSKLIDSLFGGPANDGANAKSTTDPAQGLLSGLDGLNLGPGDAAQSDHPLGLWGGSGLPGWNSTVSGTGAGNDILGSSSQDPVLESSILAGLQSLNSHEESSSHPPKSRFNWGPTSDP